MSRGLTEGVIGGALLERLERDLLDAADRVRSGEVAKAQVNLSFALELDDDGGLDCEYTHKHTTTQKGQLTISDQPKLAL